MIRGDSEAIKVSCRDESGADIPLVEGDIVYFTVKRSTNTEEKILQKIVTEFTELQGIMGKEYALLEEK